MPFLSDSPFSPLPMSKTPEQVATTLKDEASSWHFEEPEPEPEPLPAPPMPADSHRTRPRAFRRRSWYDLERELEWHKRRASTLCEERNEWRRKADQWLTERNVALRETAQLRNDNEDLTNQLAYLAGEIAKGRELLHKAVQEQFHKLDRWWWASSRSERLNEGHTAASIALGNVQWACEGKSVVDLTEQEDTE